MTSATQLTPEYTSYFITDGKFLVQRTVMSGDHIQTLHTQEVEVNEDEDSYYYTG